MDYDDLNYLRDYINEDLIEKLRNKNITRLFPVQKKIIPFLIQTFKNKNLIRPNDICVCSPTGSGKTSTFVLPVIEYLKSFVVRELRVLVILPVTDLAIQVFNVFKEFCKDSSINVASAIGNNPIEKDINNIFNRNKDHKFVNKTDILVATPGKLQDLIQKIPEFSLNSVQILIIDEADRILNSELEYDWIDHLDLSLYDNNKLMSCDCNNFGKSKYSQFNGCCLNNYSNSKNIIKLLFSATLNKEQEKLQILNLFEPLFFNFSSVEVIQKDTLKYEVPKTLKQRYIQINNDLKPAMVAYLLKELGYKKILCFIQSKEDAHRLSLLLKEFPDIKVFELTSSINANLREKLKISFSNDEIDIIICSDILTRGIDLQNVNYVVNYEPPSNTQTYVHRVGRTARAGKNGTAITLVDKSQLVKLRIVLRKITIKSKFTNLMMSYDKKLFENYVNQYTDLLTKLKKIVHQEKIKQNSKRLHVINK